MESFADPGLTDRVDGLPICPDPIRLYRHDLGARMTLPCRRRQCPVCGPYRWRPRVLAGLHSGLGGDPTDYLAVLLTAPGDAGEEWNGGASERWHRFVTELRRRFPGADLQYWRVAELQERGLVHFHVVLRGLRFLPVRTLRRVAVLCGFGSFVGVRSPRKYKAGVRGLGWYFGKYLLKSYDRAAAGVAKLVTCSYGWRVNWKRPPVKPAAGGWFYVGRASTAWSMWLEWQSPLVGVERRGPPTPADSPGWWRSSWQAGRRREAPAVGPLW